MVAINSCKAAHIVALDSNGKSTQNDIWYKNVKVGLSLAKIGEHNRRNNYLAQLIEVEQSILSAKLRNCYLYVQRYGNIYYPNYRCREHHLCGNCHWLYSQQLAEQFFGSCQEFYRRFGTVYRLLPAVIHFQLDKECLDWPLINSATDKICRRFRRGRINHNCKILCRNYSANRLIGPALFTTHIQPQSKFKTKSKFICHVKTAVHLHALLTIPAEARVKEIKHVLAVSAQNLLPNKDPPVIKYETRSPIGALHKRNLLAYLTRAIKPHWNPQQTWTAYQLLQQVPRRLLVRPIGMEMPQPRDARRRFPLIGSAFKYDVDTGEFVPVFLHTFT